MMPDYNDDYDTIKNNNWQIGNEDTIFGPKTNKGIPSDLQKKFQEILEATKEAANQTKPESEIDYEPITIDRRRDIDYIDKLAPSDIVALLTLAELVAQGKADFLFIEHPETRDFWHKHCNNLGKLRAKEAAIARKEELRKSALGKLTEEEKKALGIK